MRRFHRLTQLCFFLGMALLATAGAVVRADGLETLILKSGDRFQGRSLGIKDGAVRWKLPQGAEMGIDLDLVDRIEYAPSIDAAPDSAPPSDPEAVSDVVPAGGPILVPEPAGPPPGRFESVYHRLDRSSDWMFDRATDWTKRLEFGARFLDGNTNNDFIDVKTLFEHETALRSGQFEAGGQYGQASGDRVANRWFANGNIDFAKEGDWIVFTTSKNEYDEFENLDYRGTFAAGLGYRFWNDDQRRLIARLGPGVTYENFSDPDRDRTTPDLFGELETHFPLSAFARFEHKTTINPSLDDLDVFRLQSNYGLLLRLDKEESWSLKFGVRHEYNSKPNPGREKNDYTSSILLVYTRK